MDTTSKSIAFCYRQVIGASDDSSKIIKTYNISVERIEFILFIAVL